MKRVNPVIAITCQTHLFRFSFAADDDKSISFFVSNDPANIHGNRLTIDREHWILNGQDVEHSQLPHRGVYSVSGVYPTLTSWSNRVHLYATPQTTQGELIAAIDALYESGSRTFVMESAAPNEEARSGVTLPLKAIEIE